MNTRSSPPATGASIQDLVLAMLDCYGAKFTDQNSKQLAVDTWVQQFQRARSAGRVASRDEIIEECAKACDVIANADPHSEEWMKWDEVTAAEVSRRIRALKERAAPQAETPNRQRPGEAPATAVAAPVASILSDIKPSAEAGTSLRELLKDAQRYVLNTHVTTQFMADAQRSLISRLAHAIKNEGPKIPPGENAVARAPLACDSDPESRLEGERDARSTDQPIGVTGRRDGHQFASSTVARREEIPPELFDGMAVYVALGENSGVGHRDLAAVLDAVVRLIRKRINATPREASAEAASHADGEARAVSKAEKAAPVSVPTGSGGSAPAAVAPITPSSIARRCFKCGGCEARNLPASCDCQEPEFTSLPVDKIALAAQIRAVRAAVLAGKVGDVGLSQLLLLCDLAEGK